MSYHRLSVIQGRAISDKRLDNDTFRLLCALGMYADSKEGWCWPSQESLAKDIGRDRTWVNKKIKLLVSLGYIQSQQRTGEKDKKLSNMYRLLYDTLPPCDESRGDDHIPCDESRVNFHSNVSLNVSNTNTATPSPLPIEWQIAAGNQVTSLPDNTDQQYRDSANLLAMSFGTKANLAFDIAYTFMKVRGMLIPESKIKGQRKAVKEMIEMKVTGKHVEDAIKKLSKDGLTIKDLYSVAGTAQALANPMPADNKPNKYVTVDLDTEDVE